ncbi:50S ribosomal protein L10 [Candidatus Falkowbacteria bacterium CG10_big_fil_rev_8_21_14_0_10_37_14]|uniref:Large ribosomal subunit protein uL10 n=1 Tax=Candidatus Falkowbacteria bacterium CG10_big_fil_rev_8_21_14_0_10_37_14 TaxID=1974561 RepID=A0A2M6WT87_9BACT|nr:50S ribosomal protein L10 [Candidatus Falkowbacteria bacterium]PIT95985.1 MAG: 50S ribosomal protein L10 [Candidatus Falkowbacteria bacterium CG10_big_fil_rev_8_21_14_0_10_37_14]
MAKTKAQKAGMLADLERKIAESKSMVFARFSGLSATESRELNKKLKAEASECYVAKKTLLNKALKAQGIEGFSAKDNEDQAAAIFGYGDEVAPAKLTREFIKGLEGKKMSFTGGVLEGHLISKEQVEALAQLPSKQQLLGQLVGTLNAPVSGFVNVLAGNLRGLVRVLSAVAEQKK